MSDIDIAAVDSLKVLDLNRPIREADKLGRGWIGRKVPIADIAERPSPAGMGRSSPYCLGFHSRASFWASANFAAVIFFTTLSRCSAR